MTRTKIMVMNGDGGGAGVDANVGSTRTQLMIWRLCIKCCRLLVVVVVVSMTMLVVQEHNL